MLGETNERSKCDGCKKIMPADTPIWIDLDKNEIFCRGCRAEDGEPCKKSKTATPEGVSKHVVIEHRSRYRKDTVERLVRDNRALEIRVTELETSHRRLRTVVRALFEMVKGEQKSGVKQTKTLEEELIRLRKRKGWEA